MHRFRVGDKVKIVRTSKYGAWGGPTYEACIPIPFVYTITKVYAEEWEGDSGPKYTLNGPYAFSDKDSVRGEATHWCYEDMVEKDGVEGRSRYRVNIGPNTYIQLFDTGATLDSILTEVTVYMVGNLTPQIKHRSDNLMHGIVGGQDFSLMRMD